MADETNPPAPVDPTDPQEPVSATDPDGWPIHTPHAEESAPAWSEDSAASDTFFGAGPQDVPAEEPVESPVEEYAPEVDEVAAEPEVFGDEVVVDADAAAPVEPDPAAADETAVIPVVAAPAPEPELPPMPASLGPTIPSGSRVVVMVSRGPAPVPPTAYVPVPQVEGLAQGEALAKLQEAGLPSQVFNDYHEKLPRGEVTGQLPMAGASVPSGSESVLLVSSGPAAAPAVPTTLPSVIGLGEADAVSRLQAAGLSPQLVREYSANVPDGVVVAQLPNSNSLVDVPKKRSLLWLWIVLAVLVVAAIAVAGYLYLNRTGVVPAVVGLTQAEATTALSAAGFSVGSVEMTQTLKASDVGKVVKQSPDANSEAKMTEGIVLWVSGGQKLLDVPTVTGKTQADAEKALKDAGLTATVSQGFSNTVVKGVVISQAPKPGQKVPSETSVGIVVSEGIQNINVVGVVGQTQANAVSSLKAQGLSVQVITDYAPAVAKGKIADQFPSAGTAVLPGTVVGVLVSNGPTRPSSEASAVVPSVVGQTQSMADSSVTAVKLNPVAVQWAGTGKPANQVIGQLPTVGFLASKGASVLIFASNGK